MKSNTKQIIVVRKDLNMRKGKIASQCCHASMAFLTKKLRPFYLFPNPPLAFQTDFYTKNQTEEINHWLQNSFKKIVCYVNSEEELVELHQKALDAGLISHLIEDNGATEFNGVKTKTAIAIGPHFDERFEEVTSHLPLL
jgi:PTH2 family peptidyl-tRNA hydrolase